MLNNIENDFFEKTLKKSLTNKNILCGVNVSPLIRRKIKFNYLSKKDKSFKGTNFSTRNLLDILKCIHYSVSSLWDLRLLFKEKKREFVFLGFSRRIKIKEQAYMDIFHDPIIKELKSKDCLMIEKPFKFCHYQKRTTSCDILDFDFAHYTSYVLAFFLYFPLSILLGSKLKSLVKSINDDFSSNVISRRDVIFTMSHFKVESFFARIILKMLKPKKLIVTSRWLHYPFIFEAKKMGVQVVEIQHGCVMRNNFFYTNFDESMFEVDYMLTFSKLWNNRNWNTQSVLAIGTEHVSHVHDKVKTTNDFNEVLVVSQPELYHRLDSDIELLSTVNPTIQFRVKLHPQDISGYTSRYPKLVARENVTFITEKAVSIPLLLRDFNLVLGYTSSILFEAAHFGCIVGVLTNDDEFSSNIKDYFDDLGDRFYYLNCGDVIVEKDLQLKNDFEPLFTNISKKVVEGFFYEENN